MAYQALYRKYRPSTFKDFIDQDNTKKILINSIKNGKISHAYLFSGPRGIGKTSMAKIFAKAINCECFSNNDDVCNECENCSKINDNSVDIVEIDAASNNGVDQIRDLKNKISIVPSELKYKVYIIDEVHMLTNSAFNALLKTLEEPPSYVVFILATTEFYEVPETIVSRCQCFSFNRISLDSMNKRLKYIANNENITIDDDVIEEISYCANGGLRDAIGMLDKLNSFTDGKITLEEFKNINGMISQEDINQFYESVFNKNTIKILEIIDKISEQGYDFKNFVERVMILTRDKIVDYYVKGNKVDGNIEENIEFVSVLNDILNRLKEAINPLVIVQIFILKFINTEKNISQEINLTDKNISREMIGSDNNISQEIKISVKNQENISQEINKVPQNTNHVSTNVVIDEKVKKIRINNAMATANINLKNELSKKWDNLSTYFLDDKYGKISQLLSDCFPMVVGDKYVVLTAISDGLINNLYENFNVVEEFFAKFYHECNLVFLLNDEFESVKKQYIEDRKNNIVYHVQEECGKLVNESNNLASQVINLFGKDIVDIE